MSKWLGQRFGKRKQKTRQLGEKEFNIDSLRSLIERAVTDAEQIVASIKMKAQTEAEEEAAKIIDQAKQRADEIRRRAELAAQKEVTVSEPAEAIAEEVTVSEPAEATAEELPGQRFPEEEPDKREPVSTPLKLDSQALYSGEVELVIAVPVDPAAVSKLYNHLQATPEVKILYIRGSWDKGTTITVTLDRPLPLIGMISKIPGIEIALELPKKDNLVKGTSSSLMGAKGKGMTRIGLSLKEK